MTWVVVVVLLLVGCKKEKKHTPNESPTPTASGAPVDAAAAQPSPTTAATVDAGEPDPEVGLRAGKRTGLGAPDEKPEVAVEALIKGIAEGTVAPARLIDPAAGFVKTIIMPGAEEKEVPEVHKRLCGKAAENELVALAKNLVAQEAEDPSHMDHVIACSNNFLASPDPEFGLLEDSGDPKTDRPARPLAYALCRSDAAGEYDANIELFLLPDPERGLHVAGALTWESGMNPEGPWASFADDLFKGKCK